MKKCVVMGSCRVVEPMLKVPAYKCYPGGHVHSTGEMLQAVSVMKGEMSWIPSMEPYLFHGHGIAKQKLVPLKDIEVYVLEISSLKNFVYEDKKVHIGYFDRIKKGLIKPLPKEVRVVSESHEEVLSNLDKLRERTDNAHFVIFCQNNLPAVNARYRLGAALTEWCKDNKQTFIDPTVMIAKHGIDKCICTFEENPWVEDWVTIGGVKYDTQHYTVFMKAQVEKTIRRTVKGILGAKP